MTRGATAPHAPVRAFRLGMRRENLPSTGETARQRRAAVAIVAAVTLPSPTALRPAARHGAEPWRRSPPLALAALLVYAMLLVYGSLSPWSNWRSLGVGPFAYLTAPWPAYVTAFDLTLNVLAYLPLGLLLALALRPRLRGATGVVASIVIAAVLSILLEGAQSYLPARIASNLDALANIAGAAFGAVAAAALAPSLIDDRRLSQARRHWLRPHAAVLLTLVALWPLAQTHPGPMLFGNGELDREIVASLLGLFGRVESQFDAGRFAAAEVLVTACAMLGAGAAMTAGLKERAPRRRLLLALIACALAAKAITYGHEFGPERAFGWLTTGERAGLAIGLLAAVAAAATASARTAALVAAASLLVLVVTVNAVPSNPYHAHWLSEWRPGHLRNVAAASEWLARAWPYAMAAALLWTLSRPKHPPDTGRGPLSA
jgi:VanZ family protein